MTRKAIVTGHSRGLGAALAGQLETARWQVLGVSRSAGATVDLSSVEALQAWLDGGELAAFLDDASEVLLINNAATVSPSEVVGAQSTREISTAVTLNVTAALVLTDAVLSRRSPGTPLRIVHISSGAGRHPYPGWSIYCATKAALDMHAQVLKAEGHQGVRIAAIAPGVVDTQMQATIRGSEGFPLRERFVELKQDGQLVPAEDAAARILALIERPDFGDQVIADVRD